MSGPCRVLHRRSPLFTESSIDWKSHESGTAAARGVTAHDRTFLVLDGVSYAVGGSYGLYRPGTDAMGDGDPNGDAAPKKRPNPIPAAYVKEAAQALASAPLTWSAYASAELPSIFASLGWENTVPRRIVDWLVGDGEKAGTLAAATPVDAVAVPTPETERARRQVVERAVIQAIRLDAEWLKARPCGDHTMECMFRSKGETVLRRWVWRARCGSMRCGYCAGKNGQTESRRMKRQHARDVKARRAPWISATLHVDRDAYVDPIVACRDIAARTRAWIRSVRTVHDDAAYHVTIEVAADGWPHAHVTLRSASLAIGMLVDADLNAGADWKSWPELCARSRRTTFTRCPVKGTRDFLGALAARAGLAAYVFVAPVRDVGGYCKYLGKPGKEGADGKPEKSGLIPRGLHRYRASGRRGNLVETSWYCDEEQKPEQEITVVDVAIHRATIADVLAHHVATDVIVSTGEAGGETEKYESLFVGAVAPLDVDAVVPIEWPDPTRFYAGPDGVRDGPPPPAAPVRDGAAALFALALRLRSKQAGYQSFSEVTDVSAP